VPFGEKRCSTLSRLLVLRAVAGRAGRDPEAAEREPHGGDINKFKLGAVLFVPLLAIMLP
jgi:hypothetical protein